MRGFSMDVETLELESKLPDGRNIEDIYPIDDDHHIVYVSLNGMVDTVFTHSPKSADKPNVFIGLCFNTNIETARRLNLCVRSYVADSNYGPEVLFDFQTPEKIWDRCYKIETLNKTFYVKTIEHIC